MANKFDVGQKVVCKSEDFPLISKYGGTGQEAKQTPKKGEALVIDEILGDFLRFDKYDTEESHNWWHYSRFAPYTNWEKELVSNLAKEYLPLMN